jgi:hypothetical protein
VRATEVDGQGFEIAETIPAPAARDATVRAYPLIVRHRVAPWLAVGQWVTWVNFGSVAYWNHSISQQGQTDPLDPPLERRGNGWLTSPMMVVIQSSPSACCMLNVPNSHPTLTMCVNTHCIQLQSCR